jgi:hypothetical protein
MGVVRERKINMIGCNEALQFGIIDVVITFIFTSFQSTNISILLLIAH